LKDINLFKQYKKSKNVVNLNSGKYVLSVCLLCLIILFGAFYMYTDNRIRNISIEIDIMEKKLTTPENVEGLRIYNETKNQVNIMKTYISAVDAIENSIEKTSYINGGFLTLMNSTLPANTFLQNMNITENGVQIIGIAKNREEIAEYQHNLKSLGIFDEVFIANISSIEQQNLVTTGTESENEGNFNFALECRRKGATANAAAQ